MSFRRMTDSLIVVLLLALVGPRAWSDDQPHPIAAQVKGALKDPAKPFTMLVQLKTKEGSEAKVEAAFVKAIKPTRQEKGCLAYELSRDAKTPTQYLLYERWQNLPSLEAHLKAQHITTLLAELGDLLAAPPEVRVFVPTGD